MENKITVTGQIDKVDRFFDRVKDTQTAIVIGEGLSASDGYHTFEELYDHRITLFLALARKMKRITELTPGEDEILVWRSKLHDDGTMFEGWFIMGIFSPACGAITYHLPIDRWEEASFANEVEKAPKWDGHTAADVINRLKAL